ncbi:MAG: hypothetical protein KDH90_25875 [Anaerolineae bacterium]|nr:hypothetical protein [Anaerolineae bacterium]
MGKLALYFGKRNRWLRSDSPKPASRLAACLWVIAVIIALLPGQALAQEDPCGPGNLIWNCRFDEFTGSPPLQVPSGWTPFVVSGNLTYMQDSDTYFGPPALRMWSNGGTFTAGIYTQVGDLQPGATYAASWGWGAPNSPDNFGRKLGIDPTGGTDPNSPNVQWGALHYGPGRILNRPGPYSPDKPNVGVSAVAQAPTVTVFVWVEHPSSSGDNFIFVDQVGLKQDTSAPVAPPTPTAEPATATPEPTSPPARAVVVATQAPTETPTDVPTPTPTASPSPTPTDTPTPTATPTETPSPTATPSPTTTPTRTPVLEPRPTATSEPFYVELERTSQRQPDLLLFGGFGSLALAIVAGLLLLWAGRSR